MAERDRAICLRSYDWSETSQVVCMLTRQTGVVRLVAKGAKRPRSKSGGPLDVLAEGDMVFTVKAQGLGTLMEFSEAVYRPNLRKDAGRLWAGLFCVELVGETLPEHDPHPEVFDLLHNVLVRLDAPEAPIPAVLAYFQWRLLRRIGLLGAMNACVECGQGLGSPETKIWFSSFLGGFVCAACQGALKEKVSIEPATRQALQILSRAEAGQKVALGDEMAHQANRLLAYHAVQQIGKPLRSARYVLGAPAGK
jgi:DNA repair protein RecO (recombination protein O)